MKTAVTARKQIEAYEQALSTLLETAGGVWTAANADLVARQFCALKTQSIELVTTGHVEALVAVGRTNETFRMVIDLETPAVAKDEIVKAMMAHFTLNYDLFRHVAETEVSPETVLGLHLHLTAADPTDDTGSRFGWIPKQCFVDAFVSTFALQSAAGIEPIEVIKTLDRLKLYINESKNLESDIDAIAARLEQLRPGLEMLLALYNKDDDPMGYKGRIVSATYMSAEFWVGLYELTQDPLIKDLAKLAFMRPEGPRAWHTYERIGFVRSPKWHMNAQSKAHGLTLIKLFEYAIMTPGVHLDASERPDETLGGGLFKAYVQMLEQVPLTHPGSRAKAQFLVNKLVTYYQNNPEDRLKKQLVASAIDPSFFAQHHQILGSRFTADLGL